MKVPNPMLKQKYTKMHLGGTFLEKGGAVKVIYLVCVYKCAHAHMCAHVGPKRGNVKGYMVRS